MTANRSQEIANQVYNLHERGKKRAEANMNFQNGQWKACKGYWIGTDRAGQPRRMEKYWQLGPDEDAAKLRLQAVTLVWNQIKAAGRNTFTDNDIARVHALWSGTPAAYRQASEAAYRQHLEEIVATKPADEQAELREILMPILEPSKATATGAIPMLHARLMPIWITRSPSLCSIHRHQS